VKYLLLIAKHLGHNWIRTASTVLAMVVCIFLFCTLQTVIQAVNWGLRSANASRLVVRNAISLFYSLPLTYKEKIRAIPGVRAVAMSNFSLLKFGDSADFFRHPSYAVDAEEYLQIYPEYILSLAERRSFLDDRRGCIVGPDTAKEFGWKVGDAIQLEERVYNLPRPFEFVVSGIYRVDEARYPGTDARLLFFHHRYLEEATQNRVGAGFLVVEIEDPQQASAISSAIDAMFEDSERQTHTETESSFRAGLVSMAGNLARLLDLIGMAVIFTILAVTANTMSMAVRERRHEIAILKTLGFGSGLVIALVFGEAIAMGALGGGVGVALAHVAIRALPGLPLLGEAVRQFPSLGLSPAMGSIGFALALLLSLGAGLAPAALAYRGRVTDLLRTA
jgi:putative ABC transport system permease protein